MDGIPMGDGPSNNKQVATGRATVHWMDFRAGMESTIQDHQARRPGCHAPGGAHQRAKRTHGRQGWWGKRSNNRRPMPIIPFGRDMHTHNRGSLPRFSLNLVSRPSGPSTMSAFQTGALLHSRLPRKHRWPATTPMAVQSHHTIPTSIHPSQHSGDVHVDRQARGGQLLQRGPAAPEPLRAPSQSLGARNTDRLIRRARRDRSRTPPAARPRGLSMEGSHATELGYQSMREVGNHACVGW